MLTSAFEIQSSSHASGTLPFVFMISSVPLNGNNSLKTDGLALWVLNVTYSRGAQSRSSIQKSHLGVTGFRLSRGCASGAKVGRLTIVLRSQAASAAWTQGSRPVLTA